MQDIDVRTYLAQSAPRIPSVTVRSANALIRGGIDTMEKLCGKSYDELRKIRNMGAISLNWQLPCVTNTQAKSKRTGRKRNDY